MNKFALVISWVLVLVSGCVTTSTQFDLERESQWTRYDTSFDGIVAHWIVPQGDTILYQDAVDFARARGGSLERVDQEYALHIWYGFRGTANAMYLRIAVCRFPEAAEHTDPIQAILALCESADSTVEYESPRSVLELGAHTVVRETNPVESGRRRIPMEDGMTLILDPTDRYFLPLNSETYIEYQFGYDHRLPREDVVSLREIAKIITSKFEYNRDSNNRPEATGETPSPQP